MNIHELDAASNNSVDDIRTLVEQVRFAPQAGRYKVYIIDEVHMLSSSAFNAFLKTLEEPPPYAIFILATTEKHKILPTILSRCQIFDFKRITTADTVGHLQEICDKEEIKAEKPALQVIAQKSEGCMRDALSILDKIVSFTNGELSYANTLEHLNILDADYYFRILEAMQQQNLSDALLLYDDINRKGFEGDLVLNGLAEFIRNLLVCKDEKVAVLLEVVESFKDRYIAAGKATDAAYLISGLNVLNEAEINYKAARNKRLHVELALIKLCYLGQALQLTSGEPGGKKKQVDSMRPVSFRNIPAIGLVGSGSARSTGAIKGAANGNSQGVPGTDGERSATGARLSGTNPEEDGRLAAREVKGKAGRSDNPEEEEEGPASRKAEGLEGGAKLMIETPARTLGSLSKIRQQFSNRQQSDEANNRRPLEPTALQKVWQEYADQLRENKNPAVQSLEMATLRITDASSFEVVSSNNLEQKFIEQEKRALSDHIQKAFSNKTISFTVIIEEREDTGQPAERPLNRREQFLQIIELYPLVKELKDRLKLELDY
jgi:DNA polymerase-3 subunit gamma/tau